MVPEVTLADLSAETPQTNGKVTAETSQTNGKISVATPQTNGKLAAKLPKQMASERVVAHQLLSSICRN